MRESRSSGSVEGVMGNHDPYSDSPEPLVVNNHSLLGSEGADIVKKKSVLKKRGG